LGAPLEGFWRRFTPRGRMGHILGKKK